LGAVPKFPLDEIGFPFIPLAAVVNSTSMTIFFQEHLTFSNQVCVFT